jgi:single-strand DNA-binding protein
MASFNRVILMGNVTRDIEIRYIPSGTAVCELGMAMNSKRKDNSGKWIEEVTYVDVTLWGRTAEIASEYLNKGAPVMIEGHLKLDSWEKDGKKNYKLKVVADSMQLLGSRQGGGAAGEGSSGGAPRAARPAPANRGSSAPAPSSGPQYDEGDYSEPSGGGDDIPF